jgi:hypothetical protein
VGIVVDAMSISVDKSFASPGRRLMQSQPLQRNSVLKNQREKLWLVHRLRITFFAGHKNREFYYNKAELNYIFIRL